MENKVENITAQNIIDAEKRIKGYAHRTPVLSSSAINEIVGCNVFFKCENFQKVGAFKFRGAFNTVSQLTDEQLKKGVATHSSGNHAAALALSARIKNSKARIVMPHTAPKIKIEAVKGYGAEIIFSEPTLESREEHLQKVVEEYDSHVIPPFNDYRVITGQATCAKEIIEDTNNLDTVISPVGGGGLMSGTSLSCKYFGEGIEIIGAEPEEADDAFRSFRDKKIYPSVNPTTICDGLLTSLKDITFRFVTENVDKIFTASEENIIKSMKMIWERMKIVIEPSGAVGLAIIMENREYFEGKNIGVIITGGNLDLTNLPW